MTWTLFGCLSMTCYEPNRKKKNFHYRIFARVYLAEAIRCDPSTGIIELAFSGSLRMKRKERSKRDKRWKSNLERMARKKSGERMWISVVIGQKWTHNPFFVRMHNVRGLPDHPTAIFHFRCIPSENDVFAWLEGNNKNWSPHSIARFSFFAVSLIGTRYMVMPFQFCTPANPTQSRSSDTDSLLFENCHWPMLPCWKI